MKKSFYNTDKRKYNYIYKYWSKDALLALMDDYLADINCKDEDFKIYLDMTQNLKTKKAILNKYLNLVWDIVMEENDNIY